MNALVKKEIRLLLPGFLLACLLTFSNWLLPVKTNGFDGLFYLLPFAFCPAMVVMMALNPFGGEVSLGTLSNLLAQPISRLRLWQTKIVLLAGALMIVGFLWCGSFVLQWNIYGGINGSNGDFKSPLDAIIPAILFGLAAFSGGLWTVLLLRQVAAAFWFTLLVPGVLLMIVIALCGGESDEFTTAMSVSVLGLYSLAGFFFARWLFFRAQDLQWSGGAIVMPEIRGLARFKSAVSARTSRPRAALWRKEFMLHQSQFVMAFVLAVLHLGVLAVPHFYDVSKSRDLKFILEIFWGLWLVMPVLVGCTAVAEERKLGTLGSQLCLPVKRRTQFGIKLGVALFLSVLLGVVMPLLFEGGRILPGIPLILGKVDAGWLNQLTTGQVFFWNCLETLNGLLPLLMLALIALVMGTVAFYVSTFARNTLQSLAPAVLGILLVWGLMLTTGYQRWIGYNVPGALPWLVGFPVMGVMLVTLAYGNFKQVRVDWRRTGFNVIGLVAALWFAALTTTAIYHRAWEKLTPFEPAHGVAKLSAANPAQLTVWWAETSVRLPDGRIWTAPFTYGSRNADWVQRLLGNVKCNLGEGKFYPGSNWVSVRRYAQEFVGVKTDGTLWISEAPIPLSKLRQSGWQAEDQKMRNLQPFGSETNWMCAAPTYLSTLLVKKNGTLWRLGTDRFNGKKQAWPGLRAFEPYRLGTDSDWSMINWDYQQFVMVKTNGSIWIPENQYGGSAEQLKKLEIEPDLTVVELYNGGQGKFRSTTQINLGLQYKVGIREDGTFRIWADMHLNSASRKYEVTPTDRQIGNETNWVTLAGGREKVVTLKNDGTLWLWDFSDHQSWRGVNEQRLVREIEKTVPVQLGSHSDWIAVSGEPYSLITLAADGSLWFWPLSDSNQYYDSSPANDQMPIRPLLNVSRKPQRLGNVFEPADENHRPSTMATEFSLPAKLVMAKVPVMPTPANAPINVTLLNTSNAPDGARVAWYCLTNHTAKGVVFLADSNSLPLYSLNEYLAMESDNSIRVTNHNLINFLSSRPAPLPAHVAKIFRVEIPPGVTKAALYLNYLRQKSDQEEKNEALVNDFRTWIGLETPEPRSEPYINYPMPLP